MYDFDSIIDRRGTGSLKWDNVQNEAGKPDVLPLWVADMDFPVLPEIQKALEERVSHPIYGYTNTAKGYFESLLAWNASRYGRTIGLEQLLLTPSVMHALSLAVRTFTKPGDRILNLPPVYFPFYKVIHLNDRENVDAPLTVKNGIWTLDEEVIDRVLTESKNEGKPVKALLFSSPHNPTGRVWTQQEQNFLEAMAHKHDLLIFSDEIHADLVNPPFRHQPLSDRRSLDKRLITISGPNKTFNIAGLHISHVIISDPDLKAAMKKAIEADFFDQPNVFSMTAAWAGYRHGSKWLDELLAQFAQNYRVLGKFVGRLNSRFSLKPEVHLYPLEATYLAWMDAAGLIANQGFRDDQDFALFLEREGRVKVSHGSIFQTGGKNHLRINLATPVKTLEEGLSRFEKILKV